MIFPPLNLEAYRDWVSKLDTSSLYQEEKNLKLIVDLPGCSREGKSRASQKLEVIKEVYKNRK